jgi:hypothetical protein
LVLNGVNSSVLSPVNWGWESRDIKDLSIFLLGSTNHLLWLSESKKSLVLSISPGGELVVSKSEWTILSIGLSNEDVLSGELVESELVFLGGTIALTEGGDVLGEFLLNDWGDGFLAFLEFAGETDDGSKFASELHLF